MSLRGRLEGETLEELRRAVASEIGGRRRQTDIRLEDIHPKMSAAEKDWGRRPQRRLDTPRGLSEATRQNNVK